MSFFTSLTYYRPCEPPAVTADDLGRFIAQMQAAGVLNDQGLQSLQVRFGEAIDQDEQGTSCDEETTTPGICVMRQIEWDLDVSGGIREMIAALAGDSRRVYRAHVSLGTPTDAILQPITRINSLENEYDFSPDTLSIEIGSVEVFALGCDIRGMVGWIGVSLSGYGYLFPWTFRDVLDRLESASAIQRITEVCRAFWPVPPKPVEPRVIAARQELGELWPYEFDRSWDWYWGVQESG